MFLIFFALWLIFNAKFTLEICIFGIVLSALMYLFIWKVFGYKPKYDWLMVKLSLRGIKYFVILIWEIIKANIAVLKLIFTPKEMLQAKNHKQNTLNILLEEGKSNFLGAGIMRLVIKGS